jgi:AcrR family transcriptional regulator
MTCGATDGERGRVVVDGREYRGKEALLRELVAAWAEWEELLGRAGDRSTAAYEGDWSLRDVVAHLTSYDRELALSVGGAVRALPEMPHEVKVDVERRNRFVHEHDRRIPLDALTAEARAVRAELLARLREQTEEQLRAPWHVPWWHWPLWRRVIDISTEHYRDHSGHLRRWLDTRD